MRMARFVIAMSLLPAVLRAQDTAQLGRAGQAAFTRGEYTTAIYFLKQAVAAEPRHPAAWKDLCRAYLALDQVDAAIDACLKQIDVNPQSPAIYALGSALWRKGKRDEAIAALQQQIEVDPRDISAHGTLGHYYCELERYAEAVPELERVVMAEPNNTGGQEELGGAYLALGQTDKGLAILNKLAQDRPTAAVLNAVAYRLASHRVRLDLAQRYAETAVTNTATALVAGAETPPSLGVLRHVSMLSRYWDTLGWVHFQMGNLDEADKFLAAAWSVNPEGRIADRLGQLYERRGQKQEAIRVYARAVAARDALPETRRRLEALLATGAAAVAETDRRAWTISAGVLVPDKAAADFYAIQVQRPAAPEAQFIRGDERLRPFTRTVQDLTPAGIFPDTIPPKLVRRVTLTCPGNGGDCTMELLSAAAAVFAELNSIPPNTHPANEMVPGKPGIYRIGGGVTAPVPTYRPEPQYSKEALKRKLQGTVVLYVEVDPTGRARNIKAIRSLGLGLDEKAIEAVSQWEFRPAMKDGQPVTVAATIEVNFRLMKDH
jgi:TonB family protein